MSIFLNPFGFTGSINVTDTPPSDTNGMWLDTSTDTPIIKVYDSATGQWITYASGGTVFVNTYSDLMNGKEGYLYIVRDDTSIWYWDSALNDFVTLSDATHVHSNKDVLDKLGQDVNGELTYDNKSVGDKTKNIVFVQAGFITTGLLDPYITLPFGFNLKEIITTLVDSSTSTLLFNIQKTSDFISWENVLPNNITIEANSNLDTELLSSSILINSNETLRINILNSNSDAKNITINLKGESI